MREGDKKNVRAALKAVEEAYNLTLAEVLDPHPDLAALHEHAEKLSERASDLNRVIDLIG